MSRTYHHARWKPWSRIDLDNWMYAEPKWWRKMTKHKKRRNEVRELTNKVLRGEEEQIWPLDTKPWIYYY